MHMFLDSEKSRCRICTNQHRPSASHSREHLMDDLVSHLPNSKSSLMFDHRNLAGERTVGALNGTHLSELVPRNDVKA